jgi:hypothetical protein
VSEGEYPATKATKFKWVDDRNRRKLHIHNTMLRMALPPAYGVPLLIEGEFLKIPFKLKGWQSKTDGVDENRAGRPRPYVGKEKR